MSYSKKKNNKKRRGCFVVSPFCCIFADNFFIHNMRVFKMLLPLLVCEDEERHCFSCHLMNRMNLMVGDKKSDVSILGYGVEAGAALFPFGRCVFAPYAAVAHYLCVGEFLTEEDEQFAQ